MSNSEYVVKVVVSDDGGVKLAEKNLSGLGAAVKHVGDKHKQANQHAGDHFDTQKKGIIGTANSTRSFSKLAETIGRDGSSGLVGAYATLAANIFAVSAAFNALRSASQVEQIFKGLEAAGIRAGHSLVVTSNALKEVTGNAISTEQAMRSTAQIAAAGFGSDAIIRLGKAAKDTSFALGRNMTDSLDRLSRGIVKLEPELLDELGIMTKLTESNTLYASKLGKTETQLTNFEKRQGFLNAVLTEAELKFGGLSDAAGDSTSYDKLASTFTDLSNAVLNAINVLAKPLAGLLSSSFLLLGGAGALFASTLKNQIAPELLNSAAAAAKSAEKLREDVAAKSENIIVTRNLAKAARQQELNTLSSINHLSGKGPKVYREVADSIRDGTAATSDYDKAIVSLNKSIVANQNLMRENPKYAQGTPDGNAKQAEIAAINEQIRHVRILQETRANAAHEDFSNNKEVLIARREASIAAQLAQRESYAAAALNAATNHELSASYRNVVQATKEHRVGLILSSEAALLSSNGLKAQLIPALISARTTMYAAALSARVMGVALLNAIPIFGQILIAIGLLSAGWDALKSDAVKRLEKAFDEFNQVAEKTNDYIHEINRANSSTASMAIRTAQAMTIQSNAISEIVGKMNELVRMNKALEKQQDKMSKKPTGVASFLDTDTGITSLTENDVSWYLGLERTSKALDLVNGKLPFFLSNLSEGEQAIIKAFDATSREAPRATDRIVKFYGGWDKLKSLPLDKLLVAMKNIANEVNDEYGAAAANVEALQQSFKALDQSLADFTLGSVLTTKYDQVVKNFDAVTSAITDLRNASEVSGDNNWIKLLEGAGSSTTKFLSVDTQQSLQALRSADQIAQSLNLQKEVLGKLNDDDERRLRKSERLLSTKKNILSAVESELSSTRELFITAQFMERTYKTQADLLTAHMQANQNIYAAAGAGVKARIEQEEKIRALQALQLKTELRIQEAMIGKAKVRLQELKDTNAQILANEEMLAQGNKFTRQAMEQQLAMKGVGSFYDIVNGSMTATNYLIGVTQGRIDQATAEQVATSRMITSYKQLSDNEKDNAKQKKENSKEIFALTNSIRDGEAAILNINSQLNILAEKNLTAGEKLNQIRLADGEFQRGLLQTLEEQRKTVIDTGNIYDSIDGVINSSTDALRTQLELVKKSAKVQREAASVSANKQLSSLQDQLEMAKASAGRPGLSASEKEAAGILIRNVKAQIDLQQQGLTVTLNQIGAQERLAIVQKTYFDSAKEGMEWQKTSLDYMQKEIDASKSLVEQTLKVQQARTKLTYKKAGLEMNDNANNAAEIKAATITYKLAVEEIELKRALIDLEFALLDAQKDQLTDNLKARRDALILEGNPQNATRIAQLSSTIDRMDRVDLNATAQTAKNALEKEVQLAKIELQTAMTRGMKETLGATIVSEIRGRREQEAARKEAANVLKTAEEKSSEKIVRAETEAEKRLSNTINPLVNSNNILLNGINKWINTIEQVLSVQQTNLGGKPDIMEAQNFAKSYGLSIVEKVGGLKYKHTGKGHVEGRAFDATIAAGNQDSTNPVYKERMDRLAKTYQAQGFIVLWNGNQYDPSGHISKLAKGANQHLDHMHVEVSSSMQKVVQKTASKMVAYTTAVSDKASAIIDSLPVQPREPGELGSTTIDTTTVTGSLPKIKDYSGVEDALSKYDEVTSRTVENLKQLGPEGELVAGIVTGMSAIANETLFAMKTFEDGSATFAEKFTAIASVAQTALSTVQSAVASSAQAKEAAIQREIDAEQKRDGKSAESVAKIQALEKKKDEIARKQFNTNKKLMIAQAIISTAAGVAQALSYGPILGPILAGVVAAMGAAQIAIIAGTNYQSTNTSASTAAGPSTLTIGKRGDTVDLAKSNSNVGGEIGYLRGTNGVGTNASNYKVIGSAYGGELPRGYGNSAYVVGEKGPEIITPQTPISVNPVNDNNVGRTPIDATININALDSKGVAELLVDQRGNIISMLREAANANGQTFLENVNTNVYTKPNVSRL